MQACCSQTSPSLVVLKLAAQMVGSAINSAWYVEGQILNHASSVLMSSSFNQVVGRECVIFEKEENTENGYGRKIDTHLQLEGSH